MGQGYEFKCKCGYSYAPYLGVGFLFSSLYKELIISARKGELGEELQKFLADHPDGAINAETVALKCKTCGEYWSAPDLSMYCPKGSAENVGTGGAPASEDDPDDDRQYYAPWDLEDSYDLYAEYKHKCTACGGEMERVDEEELVRSGITCPRCGKKIQMPGIIMWD